MKPVDRSEFLVRHMAAFLRQRAGQAAPAVNQVIERLVRRTVDGHIAIELTGHTADPGDLRDSLLETGIIGVPGEYCPIVLDESNRLYLYRYWDHEQKVAAMLKQRAEYPPAEFDQSAVARKLGELFVGEHVSPQKTAAAIAAFRRLTVVSGGPGTGKTTAVVRILALLLEMVPGLHIAVAAPTGKAAARASDAVRSAGEALSLSTEARERIPREAATIHRLLGLRPGYSRYNADNLLPYDVVVIDEASMIGVSLMAQLLAALRPDCRLILLGDKDQLSSVEPGSVLGDICSFDTAYSAEFVGRLAGLGIDAPVAEEKGHALQDCVVRLTHSFRFGADSGIGRLAAAIRCGDADYALAILRDPAVSEVQLHEAGSVQALHESLAPELLAKLRIPIESVTGGTAPDAVLQAYDSFRLLCALRRGPAGVAGLNALAEQVLSDNGLIDLSDNWYAGRPVMISSNDYMLKLFNGDIGVTVRRPDDDEPRVIFESEQGLRVLHTPRLPEHETVFAMTVHKSQGSEFDEIAFVLPDEPGELLGRELLYTAVTRARRSVTIYGQADVLHAAIGRVQQRASGLADKLRLTHKRPETD